MFETIYRNEFAVYVDGTKVPGISSVQQNNNTLSLTKAAVLFDKGPSFIDQFTGASVLVVAYTKDLSAARILHTTFENPQWYPVALDKRSNSPAEETIVLQLTAPWCYNDITIQEHPINIEQILQKVVPKQAEDRTPEPPAVDEPEKVPTKTKKNRRG